MKKELEMALTASVGEFIREVRQGNPCPSMSKILKSNGVTSPSRAKQLVERMLANHVIYQTENGALYLKQVNFNHKEIMPMLLKREYNKKQKVETPSVSLSDFSAKDLVAELRSRGYKVSATIEVITVEEL